MVNPFFAFIRLVELDHHLAKLADQRRRLEAQQTELTVKRQQLVSNVAHAQENVHSLQKELARQELELRTVQTKQEQVRKKLEIVGSTKEWTALDHELQGLVTQQQAIESVIFGLWQQIEVAERSLQEEQRSSKEADQLLIEQQEALRPDINALEAEHAQYVQKRAAAVLHAPEEYMKKYELMRAQLENPVVPVVDDCCSSCASLITKVDLAQLKRHLLVPCRSCYRLLYAVRPEEYRVDGNE